MHDLKTKNEFFSYSFPGNYSFLDLEIQRSVHKCAETIQGRKLYEEMRYVDLDRCSFFVEDDQLHQRLSFT